MSVITLLKVYRGAVLAGGELLVMERPKLVSPVCIDVDLKLKDYYGRECKPCNIKGLTNKFKAYHSLSLI